MEVAQKSQIPQGEMDLIDIMHGYRVAELGLKIARNINMSNENILNLYTGAIFHDIGKPMIPRKIRNKPGKLNKWEKNIMNSHVKIGAKIGIHMNLNIDSLRSILGHHESYDGSGYPTGSKGENIPLGGRILKICDVYDALRMDRPYRKAYSKEKALEIMEGEKHTFDPKLYEVFKVVIDFENENK